MTSTTAIAPNHSKDSHALPPTNSDRNRKNKRRRIWVGSLIMLFVAGGGIFYLSKKPGAAPVTYQPLFVERGNIRATILSTGNVQPENRLEIKPPIAGRIERVLIQEGDVVYKGQILAWMSSTERAGLLDAARAKGPEEVARWEELYQPTPIMAPIAGTIILKSVEAGQTFANTDVVLAMSDRLLVKASVDETDIAQIHLDQRAEVTLDAYPLMKIPSKVERISFEAKTVNNVTTYTVDVLADEVPDSMRSGMTANISFILQSKKNVLVIPSSALRGSSAGHGSANNAGSGAESSPGNDSGAGTVNSVLIPDPQTGQPIEHEIKIGVSDGKRTEVVSGLEEGDKILVANFKTPVAQLAPTTNPFAPMPPKIKSKSGSAAQPPPPPHP